MSTSVITRVLLAAAALSMLAACGKAEPTASPGGTGPATPEPSVQVGPALGAEFDLERGKTTTMSGSDVAVAFREVTQDSRCKPGQTCVWEGDATVALTVAGSPVEVHTNKQFPVEAVAGGYKVQLVKLDWDGVVATLTVTKSA
ncbi:hypothetical protein [Actinokineospora sp. NBRC 105648]|uniref:hypothetical protein n=1 Tax=Actinokineospora sp. NBRC 105648 TaxID=3032206 RepID=UPI0024A01D10|nr:hypothetical protein [Actinokineospora sp. NBRC 105648]GLZ40152.1 hypothetical protein Acsp05_37760 [Actinokineospora sp. NBRC 105648]